MMIFTQVQFAAKTIRVCFAHYVLLSFFFLSFRGVGKDRKDQQQIRCKTVHINLKRMYFFSAFKWPQHFSHQTKS